jgi:hypothetical protein
MTTTRSFKKTIVGVLLSGGVALAGLGFASATAHAAPYGPLPEPRGGPKTGLPVEPLPQCLGASCAENMFGNGQLVSVI